MPLIGLVHNVITHIIEQPTDFESGSPQVLYKRTCKGTIGSVSVKRSLPIFCCVNYQCTGLGLNGCQTTRYKTRGSRQGALHLSSERIITTGIENNEPQSLRAIYNIADLIKRDGLEIDVAVSGNFRIDRNKVICTTHLHSVPCVINQGPVGCFGLPCKITKSSHKFVLGQIDIQSDNLEAHPF